MDRGVPRISLGGLIERRAGWDHRKSIFFKQKMKPLVQKTRGTTFRSMSSPVFYLLCDLLREKCCTRIYIAFFFLSFFLFTGYLFCKVEKQ